MARPDEFEQQVLVALVEGYLAREGMKDRIRALNEWEIARRFGYTELSYAEYDDHPARDQVLSALLALQRQGLVAVWERGAKYDSFVPTEAGTNAVTRNADHPTPPALVHDAGVQDAKPAGSGHLPSAVPAAEDADSHLAGEARQHHDRQDALLARLDEIIRLLRSIDAKLTG